MELLSTGSLRDLQLLELHREVFESEDCINKHNTSVLGKHLRQSILVTESELVDTDPKDESDNISVSSISTQEALCSGHLRRLFEDSQHDWLEDPIISRWRQPTHHIYGVLRGVESLHHQHAEIDTSWPFHFKSFETQVIRAKGTRVGDPNASGYVCNWGEANAYCIRALQQELRETCPDQRPLLVYDQIDNEIAVSAERLFGLELCKINLSQGIAKALESLHQATSYGLRPIIFAATLASYNGRCDSIPLICKISESLPVILHIDASRNFDFITTLAHEERQQLGIEKLKLGARSLQDSLRMPDGSVLVSTIVAGGSNHTSPAPVVALKPLSVGSTHVMVSYTRASDSTLAGSRDAIAPLWVALQEVRFGETGFRLMYRRCSNMRKAVVHMLRSHGVDVSAPEWSLDILINGCSDLETHSLTKLGGIVTRDGHSLITVQPNAQLKDFELLAEIFSISDRSRVSDAWRRRRQQPPSDFSVPKSIVDRLRDIVHSWKIATRVAAGYPFHMGSYSALGPVIGQFMDVHIPKVWIEARSQEILDRRLRSFGQPELRDQHDFKGAFTNGSTMGNRIGIHNALTLFPGAYLYYSSETHYSVAKTARDYDVLTNRWSKRSCRFSEIPANSDGSMCVEKLVRQAMVDRNECQTYNEPFRVILFLNMGTTLVGARDGLREIRKRLAEFNITISYIHMDGALDFGFHNCGVLLGPPGVEEVEGVLVVQGVTLSHHKAMGNMVSGEVLCYSPAAELTMLGSEVDPRAVFETWLYMQVYTDTDLAEMHHYCLNNAARLETSLQQINIVTKRNDESAIVVLERPPAWITEEFSLRPQEDWVHLITMPHISAEMTDLFVQRIAWVDEQCEVVFRKIESHLSLAMWGSLKLKRIQCCSELANKVRTLAQSLTCPVCGYHESVDLAIKASLHGALSVAAVDESNDPRVVFLIESTRYRKIRAGPILAKTTSSDLGSALPVIAQQLVRLMSIHLHAPAEEGAMSYTCLPLIHVT